MFSLVSLEHLCLVQSYANKYIKIKYGGPERSHKLFAGVFLNCNVYDLSGSLYRSQLAVKNSFFCFFVMCFLSWIKAECSAMTPTSSCLCIHFGIQLKLGERRCTPGWQLVFFFSLLLQCSTQGYGYNQSKNENKKIIDHQVSLELVQWNLTSSH